MECEKKSRPVPVVPVPVPVVVTLLGSTSTQANYDTIETEPPPTHCLLMKSTDGNNENSETDRLCSDHQQQQRRGSKSCLKVSGTDELVSGADELSPGGSRRRSVHFDASPSTVVVPGAEENESRKGDCPVRMVHMKEVHPGPGTLDMSDEDTDDEGSYDEDEKMRLKLAKDIARRQSAPASLLKSFDGKKQRPNVKSSCRSPPFFCSSPAAAAVAVADDDKEEDDQPANVSEDEESNSPKQRPSNLKLTSTHQRSWSLVQRLQDLCVQLEHGPMSDAQCSEIIAELKLIVGALKEKGSVCKLCGQLLKRQ